MLREKYKDEIEQILVRTLNVNRYSLNARGRQKLRPLFRPFNG
jgi:hypothetical protein